MAPFLITPGADPITVAVVGYSAATWSFPLKCFDNGQNSSIENLTGFLDLALEWNNKAEVFSSDWTRFMREIVVGLFYRCAINVTGPSAWFFFLFGCFEAPRCLHSFVRAVELRAANFPRYVRTVNKSTLVWNSTRKTITSWQPSRRIFFISAGQTTSLSKWGMQDLI